MYDKHYFAFQVILPVIVMIMQDCNALFEDCFLEVHCVCNILFIKINKLKLEFLYLEFEIVIWPVLNEKVYIRD